MRRFADRVVLITGGAGAIGSASARRFAEEGASVVLVDLDARGTEQVTRELAGNGHQIEATVADVADVDEAVRAVRSALDRFGRLDVIFNNAGVAGARPPIQELTANAFDAVMRVNVRGAFLILSASAKAMISGGGGGAIVNMSSSMAGWDVLGGGSAYAASKHAILRLTRTAALDLAPYGIRVNAVCPGVVETPLGIPDLVEGTRGRDRFAARIPLRRVCQPTDVAAAVAFLASDDAKHMTGTAVLVDGWPDSAELGQQPRQRGLSLERRPESLDRRRR
jgi:NAD(P)-dependent dehydrogenase (short-subunit alcohol dehydrogenase family)